MSHLLTEADAFTADVPVPDDGDDRNAASVEPAFQSLANRTRHLLTRLNGLAGAAFEWTNLHRFAGGFQSSVPLHLTGGTNEIAYTDAAGAPVPRSRTTYVPLAALSQLAPTTGDGWQVVDGSAVARSPLHDFVLPLVLPSGARLMRVDVRGVAAGSVDLRFVQVTHGGSNSVAAYAGAVASGVPATTEIVVDQAVDAALHTLELRVRSSDTLTAGVGAHYGSISYVRLIWLDPGPRNF
ncbi:MAG TPA: hypothetical protein VD838_11925 [Anaeromyxobacteraceae bacterium]|nr:hypothetical protein [Anaeromyxobacteraceae bacterium]